jgi:hypothetical protein
MNFLCDEDLKVISPFFFLPLFNVMLRIFSDCFKKISCSSSEISEKLNSIKVAREKSFKHAEREN